MQLLFAGDVMLGRLVNEALKHQPPEYPWGDTLDLVRAADWRMCNLECALSDRGEPWSATPKVFHFRGDAKNVAVLTSAGIDAVALANNHALDFGEAALRDTIHLLDAHAIAHAGAGTIDEAGRPAVSEALRTQIRILAFTDNMPEWEATRTAPGVCYVPIDLSDPRVHNLLDRVRAAAASPGIVVVSAHWGGNWGRQPPPRHRELGRALIDAGADIVFGHSAHVVRGVERYRDRPILYSSGDFIDDYAVDPVERNDLSLAFVVETAPNRPWTVKMHPTVIRQCRAQKAFGPEKSAIVQRMQSLCTDLHTPVRWNTAESCLETV